MATMCPAFSNKGNSYAQLWQHKARLDRDACVLRAGAVQIMQDPGRSTALGKSSMRREPSLGVAPLVLSPTPSAVTRAPTREPSGATRASLTNQLKRHGSHAVTPQGQPCASCNCTKSHPQQDGRRRVGAARRGIKAAARGAGRTPQRVTGDASEIRRGHAASAETREERPHQSDESPSIFRDTF